MAKRSFTVPTWTPVAVADNANFTDNGYVAIQGGSTTQIIRVSEIRLGGQAGSSAPSIMVAGRDSTLGATLTALSTPNSDGPLHPSTEPLGAPPTAFVASTTKPKRSNSISVAKLNLSFNAYGSGALFQAMEDEEFIILGNGATSGEFSISAFTGGTPGLMGSHVVYEPL